jgi:hypothetical protein
MKKASITNLAIIICLFCLLIGCTKSKPRPIDRAIKIINENYYVYEPNPLYLDSANEINELFKNALINRDKLSADEKQRIYSKAVALCETADESALEDAVAESREMMRGSLCMSTAAIVSQPEKALNYFESARRSLTRNGIPDEFMEDSYSATFVLEVLYLYEHKMLTSANKDVAVSTINKFTHLSKTSQAAFIEVIKEF